MVSALISSHLSNGELIGRVALAVLLGACIGLERELSDQQAGLRTHISVALGAALFGIISVAGFTAYETTRDATDYNIDPTRVASQVVVGIGFLGAGAIMKDGLRVKGLTTAASLWVMAAIGLAVGIGLYAAAIVSTVALLVALFGLRAPRRWLNRHFVRSKEDEDEHEEEVHSDGHRR